MTFAGSRAQLRIGRMLLALVVPMTRDQLCTAVPMSKATAIDYLAHLRAQHLVRVSGWRANASRHSPIYGLGADPDVPEPPRISAKTKYQRARAALHADPFKMARFKAMRNVRERPPKAATDALLQWVPRR